MVEIAFHGGAGTVTGSRYMVTAGSDRVLVDCGMYQGLKELRLRNWERCPFDAESLPFVILTHAHIDHIGMLPRLVKDGFRGAIVSTPATQELASLMLMDAARLQEEDAAYLNRKRLSKHAPALPLFDSQDARAALELFTARPYRAWTEIGDAISFRFLNAGHLLGSAMVEMRVGGATLLFSGDLGRNGTPLTPDPDPPPAADCMLLESTYGDRAHRREDLFLQVEQVVKGALRKGGVLLVPAFAVGRSQQLIHVLSLLVEERRLPPVSIHLDSPMAVDATAIYQKFPQEHEAGKFLAARNVTFHRSVEESKALNDFQGPGIIISSSGMLTGGRVLHHLKRLLPGERNTVMLAGFQPAGTRGRALQAGAKSLRIHGADVPVRAEVMDMGGFSGHVDAGEAIRWLDGVPAPPSAIYMIHGEPAASAALANRIRREKKWPAIVPKLGEVVQVTNR